jgi:hypothetical protein
MTLELARKRRSQGDLIHELVEALEELREATILIWGGERNYKTWQPTQTARAVIEKAKQLEAKR